MKDAGDRHHKQKLEIDDGLCNRAIEAQNAILYVVLGIITSRCA